MKYSHKTHLFLKKYFQLTFYFLCMSILFCILFSSYKKIAVAREKNEGLYCYMRNEAGQKVLIREKGTYITDENVLLEIPVTEFDGVEKQLVISIKEEDGRSKDKVIYVKRSTP